MYSFLVNAWIILADVEADFAAVNKSITMWWIIAGVGSLVLIGVGVLISKGPSKVAIGMKDALDKEVARLKRLDFEMLRDICKKEENIKVVHDGKEYKRNLAFRVIDNTAVHKEEDKYWIISVKVSVSSLAKSQVPAEY